MNGERVMMLIDRCRSLNPHKQCIGFLRLGDKRCVEGIALDIFMEQTGQGEWNLLTNDDYDSGEPIYEFMLGGFASTSLMPDEVAQWYGFERAHDAEGSGSNDGIIHSCTLHRRNDGGRDVWGENNDFSIRPPETLQELANFLKMTLSSPDMKVYV